MNLAEPPKILCGSLAKNFGLYPLLRDRTAVFTFHRVLPLADYEQCQFLQSMVVSDVAFDLFLTTIKQHFDIVSLSSLLEQNKTVQQVNRPRAVITFDDGWKDNYDYAGAILQKHDACATLFLSTDFVGSPRAFWWHSLGELLSSTQLTASQKTVIRQTIASFFDGEKIALVDCFARVDCFIRILKSYHYSSISEFTSTLYQRLDYAPASLCVDWDQCRELTQMGFEFGSHCCSHPRLSLQTEAKIEYELQQSKRMLQQQQVRYIDALCYPYGDYNQTVVEYAKRHYQLAFTTDVGMLPASVDDPFALPRINITEASARNPNRLHYSLLRAAWRSR